MPRDAPRVFLPIQNEHARHAQPPQFQRGAEPGGPADHDGDIHLDFSHARYLPRAALSSGRG